MYKTEVLNKVKELIVNQGYTALDASKETGVCDKQIRRWTHRYGWKGQQETERLKIKIMLLGLATSREEVVIDFQKFISNNDPVLAETLAKPINDYLEQFKIVGNPLIYNTSKNLK